MNILVAEDDPVIHSLRQRQLTRWGYNVDLVVNGREAVECVRKSREKDGVGYDLCLMDVNMPVMNGIEAIQAIRQNTTYLPVIAYSANLDNKIPCLEAGADEFLLKPLPATALKEKLEACAVKQVILYLDNESLSMRRIGPADGEELTELRKLDKNGLTKFSVVDVAFRFLAHKNMQHKLFDDFGGDHFRFAEILDRTYPGRNVVHIHASQVWLKKVGLSPEQFQTLLTEEDELLKKYEEP